METRQFTIFTNNSQWFTLVTMISGLTILSNPEKYRYPWREAIRSFLPVVDELVVVYNSYSEDDTRDEVEAMRGLEGKVRVVSGVFDLRKYGWASYGIMRTTGYVAAKGDIVLMFDADGILHERYQNRLKELSNEMISRREIAYGYWTKHRIYAPTKYWLQNKHSGWYKKNVLGDKFDFYHPSGKGIPNWERIPEHLRKGVQFDVVIYGYEHVWDTKELLRERATNYGHMMAMHYGQPLKSEEEYYQEYIANLKADLSKKSTTKSMDDHPAIIRPKLESLTENDFGYNFFGMI